MANSEVTADPVELWLCQLPGITAAQLRGLLGAFGSAASVMGASSHSLREYGLAPALVARIVAGKRDVPQVAAGLKGWRRLGIVPLPLASDDYPQRLRDLPDAPLVVYVQGAWPIPERMIAAMGIEPVQTLSAEGWATLVAALGPHVGLASLQVELVAELGVPRLLGVPFGLLLARQRLPDAIWQRVAGGFTTLLSTTSPVAQPQSTMAREGALRLPAAVAALAEAVVIVGGDGAAQTTDQAATCQLQEAGELIAAARIFNLPAFIFGAPPAAPLTPGVKRLRPGKAAIRALSVVLGLHRSGDDTLQQERLF